MLVILAFGSVSYGIKIENNHPSFTVDITPVDKDVSDIGLADPYVEITSPPNGAELPTNYLEVLGYAMDSDGMNLWEYTYQYGSYIYYKNETLPNLTYVNFRIRIFNIYPGTHTVTVTFYDILNNTGSDSVTVYYGLNNKPGKPATPFGPDTGVINTEYAYSTHTTDPDNDQISYGWDWDGDNVVDQWTGYYQSGYTVETSHSWQYEGIYNIKVKAKDIKGGESAFSAPLAVHISSNNPPNRPDQPTGPAGGKSGFSYSYYSSSTDPNGDRIYYMFDWGDGTELKWDGPYSSGSTVVASHTWNAQGTYQVKVKAIDDPNSDGDLSDGIESVWSYPLPVTMPKSKYICLQNIFTRISFLSKLLARLL